MTIETARMIREQVSSQLSRKFNAIKLSFNSHIQDAITTSITEKGLPCIQNRLDTQGRANFSVVDRGSSGLQRNSEVENTQKTWDNRPKTCFTREYCGHMSPQSSVDSDTSEQNRDTTVWKLRRKKIENHFIILELISGRQSRTF